MSKKIYEKSSPLSTILEWLIAILIGTWFIQMVLGYLYQHMGLIICVILFILGCIVGWRIYDYKRRNRF